MRVLLVEDEELIGEMVCLNLEEEGFEVEWMKEGEGVAECAAANPFDLIILDIMLPKMDGIQVARALRRAGTGTPILMLTARSETSMKVDGLNAGADDYLTKPFEMPELLARVRALIRRSQGSRELPSHGMLRFGPYEVNSATREALTNEGRITLSEKEIALIELFTRHPDEILSRADILDEVWGMDVNPTERTVDNFMLRLRKLFDEPDDPKRFQTVRSKGYRFVP